MGAAGDLRALADALAGALPGREEAAEALALAVAARRHALLLGPPGCGKSLLAGAAGRAAGMPTARVALHRDVREDELLGPARLRRARAAGGGERLGVERLPGALRHAALLVLDDLDRAPGEALGALRGVLDARRLGARALPLETAVATAAPPELEAEGTRDPLEPGWLDRFAVQVRLAGVLAAGRGEAARRVLDAAAAGRAGALPTPVLDAASRRRVQEAAAALPVPPETRAAWVALAGRLAALAQGDPAGLVSDRLLREGVAVLRAHALLRGARAAGREDLRAVRHLLAARIPPGRRAEAEALVDAAARGASAAAARDAIGPAAAGAARAVEARPGPPADDAGAPAALAAGEAAAPRDADAARVERLVRALVGRIDRPRAERGPDPGGAPRRRARMRRLSELADADPVDATLWLDAELPGAPGVLHRERRAAGGSLAVLRDVSASMEGRLTRTAGAVVAGLVREAARRRMRVAYVEFHHEAQPFRVGGRLFHRRYPALLARAAAARAEGRTSYEAPLRLALGAFAARPVRPEPGGRHVVLLTDGVPVVGDPTVGAERRLARRLGVRVHTVYMGADATPELLRTLARETGGAAFRATPDPAGRLEVRPEPVRRRAS